MSRNVKIFFSVFAIVFLAALGLLAMVLNSLRQINCSTHSPVQKIRTEKEYVREITMSPCGTIRLKKIPERIITLDANYNDMLEAFGKGGALLATGSKYNFYDGFYKQIPGMTITTNRAKLMYLYGDNTGNAYDKEFFYRMRADIHHIDPVRLAQSKGWTKADVEEIAQNVGPFFANRFSREHLYRGPEPYEFYSLWELSEKIGEVYRAERKVRKMKALADRMTAGIRAKLPPMEKRPTVALIFAGKKGFFTAYSLQNEGYAQAQYRAIGLRDAFAAHKIQTYGEGQMIAAGMDLEGLVQVNPDIIIMPFTIYTLEFQDGPNAAGFKMLTELKNDPLAKRINAFRNGRIYRGGTPLQGPVFYLFQLEMAAKQVYPELFGAYREDGLYPENEQLFSRKELADALQGEPEES